MLFIDLLATSGHWVAALHLKLNVYHHSGRQFFLIFFIICNTDLWLKLLFVFARSQQCKNKAVLGSHCTVLQFQLLALGCCVGIWTLIVGQMCVTSARQTFGVDIFTWFLHSWSLMLILIPSALRKKTTTTKNSGLRTVNLWCTGLLRLSGVEICIWDSKTRNLSTWEIQPQFVVWMAASDKTLFLLLGRSLAMFRTVDATWWICDTVLGVQEIIWVAFEQRRNSGLLVSQSV